MSMYINPKYQSQYVEKSEKGIFAFKITKIL